MNFIHYEFDTAPDETIEVTLNRPANVSLLDDANYESYTRGEDFHYVGGFVTGSPYSIAPPRSGHWHLVIDLGGYAGVLRASARLLPEGRALALAGGR